jgi:hypothetical protein
MKRILVLLAFFALFANNAFADIARPEPNKTKPSKAIDSRMTIRIDKNAKEAKLIIPKNQLKQLRAELEQLDDDDSDTTAAAASLNFTRAQTVAGGLFLSLAFIFGGFWFARNKKPEVKANKTLAIGAVLFLSGALATIAYANAGPPPEARSISGKMFTPAVHLYKFATGKVKLETSDTAKQIELIVPETPNPDSE